MQETWVWSQGQEEPLEEKIAICSSILVENPMDRGAWWATAHVVGKSWTRLSMHTCMASRPGFQLLPFQLPHEL